MRKLILILAFFLSFNSIGQESLNFTKRPLKFVPYSIQMAIPIIAFEVLSKSERDKKYHFEAGYLTTATVGYFLRKKDYPLVVQILGSMLSGYIVNIAKEGADKYLNTGIYNIKDINAGGWGANIATLTFIIVTRDKPTKKTQF